MRLPKILYMISNVLQKQNAKAIIVGGAVRDHFLNLPIKDYDIEVYGLESLEDLEKVLAAFGSVSLVGKSFGVLKFIYQEQEYDFSFPRTETKVSSGHRGFEVKVDGALAYKNAAKRRDFSINAIGYDIKGDKFIDPFNGLQDMKLGQLRHIDDTTFIEDSLRVYRAVQFSARFGYTLAKETFVLCKEMVDKGALDELPKERVYEEWKKLLLKSSKPSKGFELMRELGILKRYFPELHALIDVPQSPKWHPEGDVWVHTMMCLDAMVSELELLPYSDEKFKLKMMFAILCHDLGKATHTTIEEDGRVRAIGHEKAGIAPTKSLLYRLIDEHSFIESLLSLVEHHLKPSQFYAGKSKAPAIRRLATKVDIQELVLVAKADFLGRTTQESLAGIYHAGIWLLKRAKELKVDEKPLTNFLQGRDLIALGLEPSAKFKEILDEVYEQIIEGKIGTKNEALEYVQKKIKINIFY